MFELLFVGITVSVAVAVFFLWQRKTPFETPQTRPPTEQTFSSFAKVDSLFVNAPERVFFHMLDERLPKGYFVQSKVRLEDIVRVKPAITEPRQRWMLRGRVKSRHVDFLIIDRFGRPCMVIELDGASHNKDSATHADALKTGIFAAATIPFYRVRVGEDFNTRILDMVRRLP